jgi:putative transcriptional regulator
MTATLNPQTHPLDSVLLDYAAGRLPDCRALLVNTHLALCPHCRQRMQSYEAKAGINLEDMPTEQMDASCLENLLQKIDEHGPPACIDVTIPVHSAPVASFIPEPLHELIGLSLLAANWQALGKGVFVYRADLPGELRLYRFEAGASIDVKGEAMLLILDGEIRTLLNSHGPGDIVKNNWIPSLGRKAFRELIGLIA